jgi:hypothetical protein
MEPYGLGGEIIMHNLEPMIQPIDPLQSPHLLEELIGNKWVVHQEVIIWQQFKQESQQNTHSHK